jgi:hypothetical protein
VARPNSTVVVLVGAVTDAILRELDELPNVRAAAMRSGAREFERDFVTRAHTAYVVHDRDPLDALKDAWVGFFDDTVPVGTLEVAIEDTRAALGRGESVLPDYYLVLQPESLPTTTTHWWFGALASVSPSRVVPCPASAAGVAHALGRLPPGQWWPDPAVEWLGSLGRFVPDVGMASETGRHRRPGAADG